MHFSDGKPYFSSNRSGTYGSGYLDVQKSDSGTWQNQKILERPLIQKYRDETFYASGMENVLLLDPMVTQHLVDFFAISIF